LGHDLRHRGGAGTDAGEPRGGPIQRDIGVKNVPSLAVRYDPLSWGERGHGAAADRFRRRSMPCVGVVEVGLDE
jgi:hypothetical protein